MILYRVHHKTPLRQERPLIFFFSNPASFGFVRKRHCNLSRVLL